MAQVSAYYTAFERAFPTATAGPDAYLKGCYFHWKNSVEKMCKLHQIIPPSATEEYLELTATMYQTMQASIFDAITKTLLERFPDAER